MRMFTAVLNKARHSSISWARSYSPHAHPVYFNIHFNSILLYVFALKVSSFPQFPICTAPIPHTCHMLRPSHSSSFNPPNNSWWGLHIIKPLKKIPLSLKSPHSSNFFLHIQPLVLICNVGFQKWSSQIRSVLKYLAFLTKTKGLMSCILVRSGRWPRQFDEWHD